MDAAGVLVKLRIPVEIYAGGREHVNVEACGSIDPTALARVGRIRARSAATAPSAERPVLASRGQSSLVYLCPAVNPTAFHIHLDGLQILHAGQYSLGHEKPERQSIQLVGKAHQVHEEIPVHPEPDPGLPDHGVLHFLYQTVAPAGDGYLAAERRFSCRDCLGHCCMVLCQIRGCFLQGRAASMSARLMSTCCLIRGRLRRHTPVRSENGLGRFGDDRPSAGILAFRAGLQESPQQYYRE